MKHLLVKTGFWTMLCLYSYALRSESDEIIEERQRPPKGSDTEVSITYEDEEGGEVAEQEFNSGASRLVGRNPSFTINLAAGSALINNSIESIMELFFYNLLDYEYYYQLNDLSRFGFGIGREVFPAAAGAYVVVDRFNLGPQFSKRIASFHNVPISLGVDGKLSLLDIYLRTDGIRLAEQAELSPARNFINNFFGLIPILSAVLPPSFNPNEMYDPLNLLKSPYSFPLSIGGFKTMPIGAIRSYNISGGVNLPAEFAARLPNDLGERISKVEGLAPSVGPSIFVGGEFRINVLRRSKHLAWVGLTTTKRAGGRFSAGIGRTLRLLDKVLLAKWWRGIPARVFPLDSEWLKAKANIFNQLYEYDLRHPDARMAYLAAVRGDFEPSMRMHQRQFQQNGESGVSFHFTKDEFANEASSHNKNGVILFSNEVESARTTSEIKITDERGTFFVLRNNFDTNEDFTDAITGRQRVIHQHIVEMKVIKVPDPDRSGQSDKMIYKFDPDEPDSLRLNLSMRIQDRYTDSHEYRRYIQRIRAFSQLPLRAAPRIPLRDDILLLERKKRMLLINPSKDHLDVHVTPTYLGRFDATSLMLFSREEISKITASSKADVRRVFLKAYRNETENEDPSSLTWMKDWILYGIMAPLDLINIRSPDIDFVADVQHVIKSFDLIDDAETPLEKMAAFDQLFKTKYPDRLAQALFELSGKTNVPRSVSFDTAARGNAVKAVKKSFETLKNKIFRSVAVFPPLERSRLPDEKLKAFVPGELKESRIRPVFKRIDVFSRRLQLDEVAKVMDTRNETSKLSEGLVAGMSVIVCRMTIRNLPIGRPAKLYLRIGETGKVQLGKFLLGEKVFTINPSNLISEDNLGAIIYEFHLNGPLSPLSQSFVDAGLAEGGEYQVDISASEDGKVWSDEKNFRFIYSGGGLSPAS